MNTDDPSQSASPAFDASQYAWLDSNRTPGFETWEAEIAHMGRLGFMLVEPGYKVPHWAETMRGGVPLPRLYVNAPDGPRLMTGALDRYAAELGYPIFVKTNPDQLLRVDVHAVSSPPEAVEDKRRVGRSGAPRLRYKLPPEMADGQHWTIVDDHEAVIEGVRAWLAQAVAGEEITIEACMMTDAEAEALPPI